MPVPYITKLPTKGLPPPSMGGQNLECHVLCLPGINFKEFRKKNLSSVNRLDLLWMLIKRPNKDKIHQLMPSNHHQLRT